MLGTYCAHTGNLGILVHYWGVMRNSCTGFKSISTKNCQYFDSIMKMNPVIPIDNNLLL